MSFNPVKIFTEFQPLEEMIIGSIYPPEAYDVLDDSGLRDMLKKISMETEEDLASIQKLLEEHNVLVKRPRILFDLYKKEEHRVSLKLLDLGLWKTGYPNPPLWPRDLTVIFDNKILSTYARSPNRWVEGQHFYELFFDYFQKGSDWRSMPPPLLDPQANSYDTYEDKALLYHAACILKCGRDIFYTLPAKQIPQGARGTEAGLQWIQRQIGDKYRFHAIKRSGHLDGKIALIRPGLLMSWIPRNDLPECLQSWDIIFLDKKGTIPDEFNAMRGQRYYKDYITRYLTDWIGNVEETYFDVNIISINENLVLLNGHNLDLEKKLSSYGVKCIPVNFRHRYFWDGGLHCISLDVRRRGECEDYFK